MKAYIQLIQERGLPWFINRSLYSVKIKAMNIAPPLEKLFEKSSPVVVRVNLFEVDTVQLKKKLIELPGEKKRKLVQEADEACVGKIKGFSSHDFDYGWPINWQLNPFTNKSADATKKWYRIPDFDSQRGDIKAIWEISRFSHFFLFARAFLLTEDDKYFKAFSAQLSDWLNQNPYSYGANFKCGQECALRMMSCLMIYPIFAARLSEKDTENVKELVSRCYRKIISNFNYAYKCQNNNHTLSELAGMIAGAWCTGDTQRLKWAYKTLDKVILKQFLADGGYIQQSFNYQRVAMQDIEAILRMSTVTRLDLSQESKYRILNSALQMYQCQDITGDMPNYGSNDGALIFPVTSCGYRDFTSSINTVYALLTGKRLYSEGDYDEELFWFGLDNDLPQEQVLRESKAFNETGLYTLRNNDCWLMVVAKKSINHMDQNHLDLWINGKNILCDSGTYSYADGLGRELFSTKAHNTVYCEEKEQINRIGAFAVYGQPKLKKVSWNPNSITTEIVFFSGYTHRRMVYLSGDGVKVRDEAQTTMKEHIHAKILFHTPFEVSIKNKHEVILENNNLLVTENLVKVYQTKRSLFYLHQEDMNCIEINMPNGQALTEFIINKGDK